ncbi:hypothetical protein ABFS83_09G066700 [Erythranthe nasuta]
MASPKCWELYYSEQCNQLCNYVNQKDLEMKLDAPMPWIGLYIAAASAVCTLAMAADTLRGFWSRRFWFPCKYFSLNAFTLTLLAVTMKLPLDLTSLTTSVNDNLARVSSLVLMSTAMANFMTSLGSMTNHDIALNLAALVIFVVTVAANVIIHTAQMSIDIEVRQILAAEIAATVFMILLLLILCFSAVMIPTAKRYIDLAYREMHRNVLDKQVEWGKFTVEEIRTSVRRYWVMAETGSSQFVVARSVTCVTSSFMCMWIALTLIQVEVRMRVEHEKLGPTSSNYNWSINAILVVQSIGVALGSIAPVTRWFFAARLKSSKIGRTSFRDEFKVEAYWTQRLVYWRERPLPLRTGRHVSKKLLHDAKGLLLNLCILLQIVIVLACKLVVLFSAAVVKGLSFCFRRHVKVSDGGRRGMESRPGVELDYSGYVLLLEGESELPQKTLTYICNEVDKLIQIGTKKQSKNLIKLLSTSANFNGVREFDTNKVPSLQSSREPPNCWSLPVVTLTSIAISIPKIADHKPNQLLSAVSEGLYFAKLVDKSLDINGDLTSIRHAADVVWVGVELSKKWQDKDLKNANLEGRSHMETVQKLSDIAEKIVAEFVTETKDHPTMRNPLNWPVKVIAARSMYRVTQNILLAHDSETNEELFERLSIMISDVMAACLTNLVRVITFKCHDNSVNGREESVRQAAILFGESEEILEILQLRELPKLDAEKAANIEEWRAFMELNQPASVSADPHSNGEEP